MAEILAGGRCRSPPNNTQGQVAMTSSSFIVQVYLIFFRVFQDAPQNKASLMIMKPILDGFGHNVAQDECILEWDH